MWKMVGVLIYLSALSFMDIRERKVSVAWLAAGAIAVCGFFLYEGTVVGTDGRELITGSLLGTIPGIFMLVVARLTGKAGYGDGLVLILLGISYGYLCSIVILCLSLFLLSLCSVVLLLCRRVKGSTQMPYLPFLTAAYVCAWFFKIG